MIAADKEQLLAQSLEDFRLRRTAGEMPDPEEYAGPLAEAYDEFLEMLDVEATLDELLEPHPEEVLPREFGPYTLLRERGRGAVGIVYEAVHRELGRREAIKVLRTGFHSEGTALERFRNEAKTLAQVRHEHIVHVYGADQVDGRPYYAMALLDGPTLSQLARSGNTPEPADLCKGLAGVADALHTLHEAGVIHRDVKPSNIMVAPDGRMVLADFGLARSLSSGHITRTGQALGTPLYMSPEQILGKREAVDGRTDVYGLGATMYEVLAGHPVYETDDLRVLLRMVVSERPTPLKRETPTVPPACSAIVMKSLEKRRRDRYQSAAAMRDDLRAFAAGERVQGRPVSALRRTLRRMRPYALPAAAMLLIMLGAAIWFMNRPGTLSVAGPLADAEIWVEGVQRGVSPTRMELAAGRYRIVVKHPQFEDMEYTVEVGAGKDVVLPLALPRAREAKDPSTIGFLASILGMDASPFTERVLHRGANGFLEAYTDVLLPAGAVRLADLDRYVIHTNDGEDATLVFKRGEETLYEAPFDPLSIETREPIPEEVLSKLEVGDEITWGVIAKDKPYLQTFRVEADDEQLAARLAQIDEVLANQDEAVRAYFKGRALQERGLHLAAYVLAGQAAVNDVAQYQLLPLGVQSDSLAELGLVDSDLWAAVQEALPRAGSEQDRKAWFVWRPKSGR